MSSTYPVHVDARLDPEVSRWQWLVKWLLVLPHYLVLAFLWIAFIVLSAVAFFAILFTGRYPRAIFDFNVGVLRWSWRVAYYAYGALGTDRYPPFSFGEHTDYPAHLFVEYPEHLSRGLVLVKWWLLAVPHYLVIGFFLGSSAYVVDQSAQRVDEAPWVWQPWIWSGGLIGLLVLVAAIVLLFTGRYPQPVFDLVLGLNRWVLRVAGYAALMTDRYPPFRLDQGGDDPDGRLAMSATSPGAPVPPQSALGPPAHAGRAAPAPPATRWSVGRVIVTVVGSLVLFISLGLGMAGTALAIGAATMRDDAGFVMSDEEPLSTNTYALASANLDIDVEPGAGALPDWLLGDGKVTATGSGGTQMFVGIASTVDAQDYLRAVQHATVENLTDGVSANTAGTAPREAPGDSDIWVADSSGTGTQSVVWPVKDGDWTVVVMNADGSRGIATDVAVGAEIPALSWVTGLLLAVAAVGIVLGLFLLFLGLRAARAAAPTGRPTP